MLTSASTKQRCQEFSDFLRSSASGFELDLSGCSLIECIEQMIHVKNRLSEGYGKHFSCLLFNLNYIQKLFGCTISPSQVNELFWTYFISFLTKERKLSLSTVKTVCSQLKTSVEWSARHRARISDTYDMLKIPSYCHEQIALTADEISHIYHFDVSTISRRKQYVSHMQRVKDMFVLSCNLGQRFSDMVRIERKCFDRNIFRQIQQKTGMMAYVDIEKMSIDRNTTYRVLEKYDYSSPVKTDISCYDKYLKQLLRHIGGEFCEEIKRETKVNGLIETAFFPKWKLVSSHTSRRSFITINVLRGFRPLEIMRASGHKSYTSFEKYLCYFDD